MSSMRSVAMLSRGLPFGLEAVRLLDAANAEGIALVPPLLAGPLGEAVFGVFAPMADRGETVPVRDRDADAVGAAGTFDAEKPRHGRGEFDHAIGGAVVAFGIGGGTARREDDCVVGRFRRACERVHAVSVSGERGIVSAPWTRKRSSACKSTGRLRQPA